MVSGPNARIAPLGSYFAFAGRLLAPAASVQPTAVSSAPLRMTSPAIDSLDTNSSGAPTGTIDDIEGATGGVELPTDLEMLPATYGSPESLDDGPTTASLSGNITSGRVLREGVSGADVAAMQRSLTAAGFGAGRADGFMGPRTTAAVKRFQAARGLPADGEIGPRTRAILLGREVPQGPGRRSTAQSEPSTPQTAAPRTDVQGKLVKHLNNPYKGRVHQCYRYAWTMATTSGGHGIENARVSYSGRNAQIGYLNALISQGKLGTGDVVYVNRRPGADPSSTRLSYGPHWFVYMGGGRFADQYGVRDANAMAAFVPGRKIDAIYHPFPSSQMA
jgi:peptidoglycan hydrolase-like protein with peptidoglycan-binding domain